jgi:hypothetical protein
LSRKQHDSLLTSSECPAETYLVTKIREGLDEGVVTNAAGAKLADLVVLLED